ncbi:MAG: PAS domain-containing protein [Ferruginibacter sp.]|nr:PAS domain-containing protein [Cytophagales bacterium]
MKTQFHRFIYLTYLLVSFVLLVVGVAIYQSARFILQKARGIEHTQRIIGTSDKLISFLEEAETGRKAYRLRNDSTHRERYLTALDSVRAYARALQQITSDNATRGGRTDLLNKRINQQASLLSQRALGGKGDPTAALPWLVRPEKVRENTVAIHALLAGFVRNERTLLRTKSEELSRLVLLAERFLYSITFSALILILSASVYVANGFQIRETPGQKPHRLNQELTLANDRLSLTNDALASSTEQLSISNEMLESVRLNLEEKVEQRTATLGETLQRLTSEMRQHKQTAEALRESEERFKMALESAPIAVFNQDTDLRYTWIHDSGLFGAHNVLGKTDAELMPADDASRIESMKRAVLATRQSKTEEAKIRLNGREARYFFFNVKPLIDETGQVRGISGATYDITRLKRSEENLKRTLSELEMRNYELASYVYKASHDMQGPLASIQGLIELIELEDNSNVTRYYTHLIKNRIRKSDDFISSLVDYSKNINSAVNCTAVDFEQIVGQRVEELKYLPHADRLTLLVDLRSKTVFYGDELRVGIILKNFVSNAIQYINPCAGQPYLKFDIAVDPERAVIRVEDNGIGIEEKYLGRIFDMFFRATSRSDGSGLGLYITHQTVRRLNGSISVASQVGCGTTFTLTLPNCPGEVLAREAEAVTESPPGTPQGVSF